MKTIVALLLAMLLATIQARITPAVCNLRTRNFAKDNPLVLKPIEGSSDHYEIDDPDRGDTLLFKSGQKVMFACPGTGFKNSKTNLLPAECIGRTQFEKIDGSHKKQPFESLKCNGIPKSVMKENGRCAVDKTAFAVGFEIDDIFVKVMDICFDRSTNSAIYVKHKVSHNIDGSQKHFMRPHFREDVQFRDVPADYAYKRENQVKQFREYVWWPYSVSSYVNEHRYLARGHLAAKADYVYGAQQTATFYYANTAPQWQSFNADNWERLESAVRRLAVKRGRSLTVYTGTHGQYRINSKPVYLTTDKFGHRTMPVPLVFWKVVVDESDGAAIAFTGLNDPNGDAKKNGARDACGPDLCAEVFWVSFRPSPESGLMYCCTVENLRNTVNAIPPVDTMSLLAK